MNKKTKDISTESLLELREFVMKMKNNPKIDFLKYKMCESKIKEIDEQLAQTKP